MNPSKLFRQAAIDHYASPEQLEQLIKVTDAKGWLALVACGVFLLIALTWGVFGSVPTKQAATGILVKSAGLADVAGIGTGQITDVEVVVGDYVRQGQVIARLAQPALEAELSALASQRRELELAFEKSTQLVSEDAHLRAAALAQARASLHASIASTQQRESELVERLDAQKRLYDKGLVTKETLLSTQESLRTARAALTG